MGPPLWADVFTLKTVNTAVQYPSQFLTWTIAAVRAYGAVRAPYPVRAYAVRKARLGPRARVQHADAAGHALAGKNV